MTFDEIKTFIQLSRIRNFSKTANMMYVSQSTVSARIKNLENELGVSLFDRSGITIKLTPQGRDFLNYAEAMDELMNEATYTIHRPSQFTQQISMAAPESHWNYALLPALQDYFHINKTTSFRLFSLHSWVVNQEILNGKLDLALTCQYLTHPDVVCELLYDYSYLLVAHPELQLPHGPMDVKTITQWPFIYLNWGQQFAEWFFQHYLVGSHFLEIETISTFLYLLLNKVGVGFLSERIAQPHIDRGNLMTLENLYQETAPRDAAYLVYLKDREDIVQPLVDEIKDYVAEHLTKEIKTRL